MIWHPDYTVLIQGELCRNLKAFHKAAKSEETEVIKNYLAWCQESNKPVNDSTINEYSRDNFNFSSKPDCDKMNILFGYSAFIKDLSEKQKGRVDVKDEELDL